MEERGAGGELMNTTGEIVRINKWKVIIEGEMRG